MLRCTLWELDTFDKVLPRDVYNQGRSQEFAPGVTIYKSGSLGDGSPPAGSRGRAPPRWGSGREALRSRRQMLIFSSDGWTCTHVPPGYTTVYNKVLVQLQSCRVGTISEALLCYTRLSCLPLAVTMVTRGGHSSVSQTMTPDPCAGRQPATGYSQSSRLVMTRYQDFNFDTILTKYHDIDTISKFCKCVR